MSTWPNRGASGGPCGGLEEEKTEQPKQSDHASLTQANKPPRNPVRFKWRGAVYLVATAVPMALANLITTVLSVLPGRPQPPAAVQWIEGGFYALALLLWSYCCYRLYRDHVYHDYYLAADRHQREGW